MKSFVVRVGIYNIDFKIIMAEEGFIKEEVLDFARNCGLYEPLKLGRTKPSRFIQEILYENLKDILVPLKHQIDIEIVFFLERYTEKLRNEDDLAKISEKFSEYVSSIVTIIHEKSKKSKNLEQDFQMESREAVYRLLNMNLNLSFLIKPENKSSLESILILGENEQIFHSKRTKIMQKMFIQKTQSFLPMVFFLRNQPGMIATMRQYLDAIAPSDIHKMSDYYLNGFERHEIREFAGFSFIRYFCADNCSLPITNYFVIEKPEEAIALIPSEENCQILENQIFKYFGMRSV